MVQRILRVFPTLAALAAAAPLLATLAVAGPAAAAPPLSANVVGEPPTGGGVFRFPQAIGVDSHDGGLFIGDQYSGQIQKFSKRGQFQFSLASLAARQEPGRNNVVGGVSVDRSRHVGCRSTRRRTAAT
jgi:hypothetical protein